MSCSRSSAIATPCVRHNFSFNRLPTTTSAAFSASLRFNTALKAQTSIQTDHYQRTQPQQDSSTLHPNDSTPKPHIKKGTSDPELRAVLELATNSELFELEGILFGPSYFSPALKSVTNGVEIDRFMLEEDFEERELFINILETRFLYLAADARSTLRGWRPSYRSVLLDVRKELKIPCSTRLSSEDLEAEVFIYMIQECSRDWDTAAVARVGAAELCSVLLKGGQLVSLLKISQLVSTKLSGKMILEVAKHKIEGEIIKKGLTGAASRYLGLRSLASLFGPMLWGTFLADVVIQMLGTDYFRILRAIYAFAQIRILRRHGLHLDRLGTGF